MCTASNSLCLCILNQIRNKNILSTSLIAKTFVTRDFNRLSSLGVNKLEAKSHRWIGRFRSIERLTHHWDHCHSCLFLALPFCKTESNQFNKCQRKLYKEREKEDSFCCRSWLLQVTLALCLFLFIGLLFPISKLHCDPGQRSIIKCPYSKMSYS